MLESDRTGSSRRLGGCKSLPLSSALRRSVWTSILTFLGAVPSFCPECDAPGAKPYDASVHTWRHLDFFQQGVQCPQDFVVKKVEVPWARSGSGFTLLFEALVMALAREMPVAVVAATTGEHDTRVWRIVHHHVDQAREDRDFSGVEQVAVDETASRRGHNYISSFFDSDDKRLLFAVEGRDQETVEAFVEDLSQHGGDT